MSIAQAFRDAQKNIWAKRGLVGVLYITSIVVAAALTFPVRARLQILARKHLAADLIDGFYMNNFFDYWDRYGDSFKTLFAAAMAFGLLYIVVNTFFTGGILGILAREQAFSLKKFLHECGTYFGRFFRLFLLSIGVLTLLLILFQFAVVGPLAAYAKGLEPDGANRTYILIGVLGLLLLGFWNMLFDYAKIVLFSRDQKSTVKAFLSAAGFSFRHFFRAAGVYYLNFLIVILLFVVYLGVESFFSNSTAVQTYLLLAVQQIFIILRLWMKLSFFGSELAVYYDRRPEESVQFTYAFGA